VLIILFAIVAVAIIGGIVINQVSKTGGKISTSAVCSEIDITPKACVKIDVVTTCGTAATCAQVKIMRGGATSAEWTIKSIIPIFELKDGTTESGTEIIGIGLPGALATVDATLKDKAFDLVSKAGVAVKVVDKKGQEISCDLYKTTKVDCLATA
ncbi:MAG: hypothetical protein AABX07_04515, partial [Nanoarchaeota archaeon]